MTGLKPRFYAGGIHLLGSLALALPIVGFIYFFWYPGSLAAAQGVGTIIGILLLAHLILGPVLLTLVYKPHKKEILFDLAVILAIQTAAFLYGLKIIEGGRPLYVVLNVDRFDVVASQDIVMASLEKVPEGLEPSWFGPTWVAARLPSEATAREALMFSSLGGGADLPQLPEYYVSLESMSDSIQFRQRPIHEVKIANKISAAEWSRWLEKLGPSDTGFTYLPLRANARDGVVLVEAGTTKIKGIRIFENEFGVRR